MKSAVLRDGEYASYPDCPSTRGQKHVKELIKLRKDGKRAMLVFICALSGVKKFRPCELLLAHARSFVRVHSASRCQ